MVNSPSVSDNKILRVFDNRTEVLTTGEVAEELSIGRRGVLDRLKELAASNRLHQKKIGKSGTVWWLPNSMRKHRLFVDIQLPVANSSDDHRINTIKKCSKHIKEHGSVSAEDLEAVINDCDGSVEYETVRIGLHQLHNILVLWNSEAEQWESYDN